VTADWQWSGQWPITTDAILTGAWQIPQDNRTVMLFANVSDSPFASHLSLNPKDYSLSGKPVAVAAVRSDGTRTPLAVDSLDQADVEVPARSIMAWEIRPAGDK